SNQPLVDAPPPDSSIGDAPIPDSTFQQQFVNRPIAPAPSPGMTKKLDGAGIVQRSATTFPGAPQHVLLAPNGRILAYLHSSAGVSLDEHIGQQRGVYGEREFNQSLRADLIH